MPNVVPLCLFVCFSLQLWPKQTNRARWDLLPLLTEKLYNLNCIMDWAITLRLRPKSQELFPGSSNLIRSILCNPKWHFHCVALIWFCTLLVNDCRKGLSAGKSHLSTVPGLGWSKMVIPGNVKIFLQAQCSLTVKLILYLSGCYEHTCRDRSCLLLATGFSCVVSFCSCTHAGDTCRQRSHHNSRTVGRYP